MPYPSPKRRGGTIPEWIRVSEGTGDVLGLWNQKQLVPPTTGYLMTYTPGGCAANCLFCPQAQESRSEKDKLSRISWPKVKFSKLLKHLDRNRGRLKRICIQSVNYPQVVDDICEITTEIKKKSNIPVSVSCHPTSKEKMKRLADSRVDRLCIPLDAATQKIFRKVKGNNAGGPYSWRKHVRALEKGIEVFDGRMSTHLIVGLGEKDREIIELIQELHDKDITVALFAFTPIKGTEMSENDRPPIERYRRIQVARYLIVNELSRAEEMEFKDGKVMKLGLNSRELREILSSGRPFQTSGCPDCNRPFYNESPHGPIYNFPRRPNCRELETILGQLNLD